MNAPVRLFLNAPRPARAASLLACVGAGALLAACMSDPFERARVDPKSPIAGEVDQAASVKAAYPTFNAIPDVPSDIRPKPQFGQAARQTEMAAADIARATAPDTWTLKETDRFAGGALAAVGPDLAPVDPAASDAFAQELRKRATPPPPPKR